MVRGRKTDEVREEIVAEPRVPDVELSDVCRHGALCADADLDGTGQGKPVVGSTDPSIRVRKREAQAAASVGGTVGVGTARPSLARKGCEGADVDLIVGTRREKCQRHRVA